MLDKIDRALFWFSWLLATLIGVAVDEVRIRRIESDYARRVLRQARGA